MQVLLFPDFHVYLTSKHRPLNRLQIMQSSLENQVSSEVNGLKSNLSYITPKITFCILTAGIFIYSPPITCILNSLHYQHHHRAFFHLYSPLLLILSFWSRARSLQGSESLLDLTAGVSGAEVLEGSPHEETTLHFMSSAVYSIEQPHGRQYSKTFISVALITNYNLGLKHCT